MALPVTITGLSTAVAPVGPFKCDYSIYIANTFNVTNITFGTSTISHAAQVFTVGASNVTVPCITPFISKNNLPTDNLILEIRTTSGGVPTATVVATSNAVAGGSFSSGYILFTFATPPTLTAGTQYAMVLSRSGAANATVNYVWICGTGDTYAGGGAFTSLGGSSFSTSANDCSFRIFSDVPAYYFFGRDATTATTLRAYKATAPDTSWAVVASQTGGHGTSIDALSAFQVGNIIHIASSAGGVSTCAYNYQTFDMSIDTFPLGNSGEGITSTGVGGATNGQTGAVQHGISVVVRSTGEVVVFCHMTQTKTSGTFYARVGWTRRTGAAAWSAAVQVDASIARDNINPICVLGAADRVHFFFSDSNSGVQRHLTSANVLGTAGVLSGAGTAFLDAVTYVNAASTTMHVVQGATAGSYFASADNPTTFGSSVGAGGTAPVRLVDDDFIVYALYRNSSDGDLYVRSSSNDGSSFGSGVSAFVGTVVAADASLSKNQSAYQRGTNVVFPYIVNDNGTLKYNEYTVRTLAPPMPELDLTVGAVTLSGKTALLRVDRHMDLGVLAVNVIGRDTSGLKGQLLTLQKGSVTLAGSTANLRVDRKLPLATYGVALAGKIATLRVGRKLQATAGAITLTGVDVNLRYGRGFMLTTQPGAVTLAGKDVDLIYTPSLITAYVLNLGTGAIGVTPTTAIVRYGRVLTAQKGAVAVGGVPANVRRAYTLSQTVGAVTLSGKTVNLKYGRAFGFTAGVGAIAVSMKTATLRRNRMFSLATGSIAVTGIPADLKTRINYKLTAQPGAIVVTGNPAVLTTRSDKVLRVLPGAIAVDTRAATLKPSRALLLARADIRLTGYPVILDHHIHQDYRMELAPASVVVASQYAELQYGNRQPGRMTFGLRAEIPGRW